MKRNPYIGVTGFMSVDEVETALANFTSSSRQLMIGVLVSSKTLARGTNKWPGRYPKINDSLEIFKHFNPRGINLFHYCTDNKNIVTEECLELATMADKYLDGFQLNIAWPNIHSLRSFHNSSAHRYRIVLQIGNTALKQSVCPLTKQPCARKCADMVTNYVKPFPLIHDILFDMSGGLGKPVEAEIALPFLLELESRKLDINLGIAGGLRAGKIESLIHPIVSKIPDINIDAEGGLRTQPGDRLDLQEMINYLKESTTLLG